MRLFDNETECIQYIKKLLIKEQRILLIIDISICNNFTNLIVNQFDDYIRFFNEKTRMRILYKERGLCLIPLNGITNISEKYFDETIILRKNLS